MTGRWYADVAIVIVVLFAGNLVLLWLDSRSYPVCAHCGTNARVYKDDGLPTCADHGVVPKVPPGDRRVG